MTDRSLGGPIAMTISDVCIKRPVFTWVLVALPVVLGMVAYGNLGVDLFPNVDFPVCTVTTSLSGASVEEMETTVTKPIEDIINTVSGIDELRSTTQEGVSVVTVQFLLSKNGDVGAQEVRDKVSSILANLPDGTETPIVNKFDTAAMPVMTLAISGRRDLREVTELARKRIKERLETVGGVGAINLVGGRTRSINVTVDADKLAAYSLSIDDVRTALERQNLEEPGGRIDQGSRARWSSGPWAGSTRRPQFDDLIITNKGGTPVRIKDVGRAVDSFEEPRTKARLDGENAVSLSIQKQSGVNTVKVVDDLAAAARGGQGHLARPTSRSSSPATPRGSSASRSRRSSSTSCWPPRWSRRRSSCSSATGGPRSSPPWPSPPRSSPPSCSCRSWASRSTISRCSP